MVSGKKLTPKQGEFVRQYLLDLNASAAYRRAGFRARGNAAEVNASRLLRNAKVTEAIDKAMAERAARTEVNADRVLRELAKIAFFDPRKAFNSDGSLKPISEMDDETVAVIASLDVTELSGNEGAVVRKVRLADKLRALELIGKHLNMFRDRLEISGSAADPLTLLIQQIQGSAFRPVKLVTGGEDREQAARRS